MKFGENFLKRKVILIGPYPPPIGGVSVHIKRYVEYLLRNNITDFVIFDDSNESKTVAINKKSHYIKENKITFIIKMLFMSKNQIIHYHSHNWMIRFLLTLIGKIHKTNVIFTFHSFRDDIEKFGLIKKSMARFVIKYGTYFIAVSKNEKNKLIEYGCEVGKISVIPAYINPSVEDKENNSVPNYVKEFISNHEVAITANASGIRFFNGDDLYGIDMCVKLMKRLKQKYSDSVGLIFLLPQIDDKHYFKKINERIKKFNIEKNFLFVTDKISMFPIIKMSSIFIRPTNSDGDAISIREAIDYKIPSIASDVVKRPEGTIVFKTREQGDFEDNVINVIDNYNYYREKLRHINSIDYAEELFKLYVIYLNSKE